MHWLSCANHPGTPRIRPRGDPATSDAYVRAVGKYRRTTLAWKVKGNVQLLPGEIRDVRDYLTNTNKLEDLQMYVMVLLGVKLFLRVSELLVLKIVDFEPQYQMVKSNRVDGITVVVKGKSDPVPVRLVLFADNDCTEFCPVRHLLVYLALTGITEGFLFPNVSFLYA